MNDRIRKMGEDSRRLAKVTVDPDLCMGCQKCIRTCCYDVYKWDKEKKLSVAAYSEECVECCQCMFYCPAGAIHVEPATVAFYDPVYDSLGLNNEGGI